MPRYREGISPKQKAFARQYVKNGMNGTQAALQTYQTSDYATAGDIASDNLKRPEVRSEIERVLQDSGLALPILTDKLNDVIALPIEKKVSANERIRAIEIGLKLHNAFPAQKTLHGHINLNKAYHDMDIKDLIETTKKLDSTVKQLGYDIDG